MDEEAGNPLATLRGGGRSYDAGPLRVARIVARVRRRTGVRDLVTFSCVRMWGPLLGVCAVLYVLVTLGTDRSFRRSPARRLDLVRAGVIQ
jgi:hypothetical protein